MSCSVDKTKLLQAFDAGRMDAYVIENDFLKKESGDPTMLEKAIKERPEQRYTGHSPTNPHIRFNRILLC